MGKDDGRFAELAEHSSLFGLAIVVGLVAGAIGALPLTLPLVYAAVVANLTARALGARPIYESLLDRMLAAGERAA